jgi:hypothetical protein
MIKQTLSKPPPATFQIGATGREIEFRERHPNQKQKWIILKVNGFPSPGHLPWQLWICAPSRLPGRPDEFVKKSPKM